VSWICLSINPHFLHYHGEESLGDLFFEIFGSDYIEHYSIDCDDDEKNYESDRYVFIHCQEFIPHVEKLRNHRYIKNALNSFNDIATIPEEEIMEIKSTVTQIIQDDEYCINRTGFFMFGDIVRVLHGSLSSMNGIVIKRCDENSDFYYIYFRLFVDSFYKKIHISNLEFNTSIFKFVKSPVVKGTLTESNKKIKKLIKQYDKLQKENIQKKLIEYPLKEAEIELEEGKNLDVVDLISLNSKKRGLGE
jgi:hypothetical protein